MSPLFFPVTSVTANAVAMGSRSWVSSPACGHEAPIRNSAANAAAECLALMGGLRRFVAKQVDYFRSPATHATGFSLKESVAVFAAWFLSGSPHLWLAKCATGYPRASHSRLTR